MQRGAWAAVQKQEETNGFDLFQDFIFFFFIPTIFCVSDMRNRRRLFACVSFHLNEQTPCLFFFVLFFFLSFISLEKILGEKTKQMAGKHTAVDV